MQTSVHKFLQGSKQTSPGIHPSLVGFGIQRLEKHNNTSRPPGSLLKDKEHHQQQPREAQLSGSTKDNTQSQPT